MQNYIDAISKNFGITGVNEVSIGDLSIQTIQPESPTEPLVGYGDTITPGDLVYTQVIRSTNSEYHLNADGSRAVLRIDYYSLDKKNSLVRATNIATCGIPTFNYDGGGGWKRKFIKVEPEVAEKYRKMLRWEIYFVKVQFQFKNHSPYYYVPVPLIAYYEGDIRKAAINDTPYGSAFSKTKSFRLKPSHVLNWSDVLYVRNLRGEFSETAIPSSLHIK
jgi:hypothetical protein